ncbi:MAG: PAS domain-containing protein [Chitinivibrionales bacterium]|nr:PAS domain-containing protein [Chitinivibrionales bacterium]
MSKKNNHSPPDKQPRSPQTARTGEQNSKQEHHQSPDSFPVIGIGSSAGGLEALQALFGNMPPDCAMAFIVVTHQHPDHESALPELLANVTDLPVKEIRPNTKIENNHVYVLGSGVSLSIKNGRLQLTKSRHVSAHSMPIDIFFRTLASDMHERAIAVVLSGSGTDGTAGIKEIKARGGLIVAQEAATARYAGMPGSAEETGLVDIVETPENIPQSLIAYARGPYLRQAEDRAAESLIPHKGLQSILHFISSKTSHDFSAYKENTIRRRIERRMSINGLKNPNDYLNFLYDNSQEVQQLFTELLISVTSFFRDVHAFDMLRSHYIPELMRSRPDKHEFRVWIPGCATGEEAYSIAMVLAEVKQELKKSLTIQVFGTDLDERAIHTARQSVYPVSISVDVSQERLEKFFIREGEDSYAVRKSIRDMLIFAPQNMLSDPPFMKLDMLVCRNVLIYLQPDMQKLLIPTFHYALSPGGLLMLGSSESVAGYGELFDTLDNHNKIFRSRDVPTEMPHLPIKRHKTAIPQMREQEQSETGRIAHSNRRIERFLLNEFAPVCIVVDHQGTIAYIHGKTGAFLEPEEMQPRNNVLQMAREGLRGPLASAFHRAVGQQQTACKKNVRVKTNGDYTRVNLSVSPIADPEPLHGLYLVTISPPAPVKHKAEESKNQDEAETNQIQEVERELLSVRESNQTMVEELQSSNEELQSSNEELQSTNEELQSSKEEMESLNEELSTVNTELDSKVQDLRQARDDMRNLLNSTDLGVIFLDQHLHIKRFTEKAKNLISLRDSDIDRPFNELSAQIIHDDLPAACTRVLDTLERIEEEVRTRDGSWQLMRILPYRTSENIIGGVVITFIDISQLKQIQKQAESQEFFQHIVDTIREPLLVLDNAFRVKSANEAFLSAFGTSKEQTLGKKIYSLGNGQWDIPALRELLEKVLPDSASFNDFEVEHDFPEIGHKAFVLNARRLKQGDGKGELILLAMQEK